MYVISSRGYDHTGIDRLQIESFELISYEERTIKIQVNFLHPNYISMNQLEKDILIVVFTESWFCIDSVDRQQLEKFTTLYKEIDRQ